VRCGVFSLLFSILTRKRFFVESADYDGFRRGIKWNFQGKSDLNLTSL
jgi:hypothetical protein